jgi:hypothetical protein
MGSRPTSPAYLIAPIAAWRLPAFAPPPTPPHPTHTLPLLLPPPAVHHRGRGLPQPLHARPRRRLHGRQLLLHRPPRLPQVGPAVSASGGWEHSLIEMLIESCGEGARRGARLGRCGGSKGGFRWQVGGAYAHTRGGCCMMFTDLVLCAPPPPPPRQLRLRPGPAGVRGCGRRQGGRPRDHPGGRAATGAVLGSFGGCCCCL